MTATLKSQSLVLCTHLLSVSRHAGGVFGWRDGGEMEQGACRDWVKSRWQLTMEEEDEGSDVEMPLGRGGGRKKMRGGGEWRTTERWGEWRQSESWKKSQVSHIYKPETDTWRSNGIQRCTIGRTPVVCIRLLVNCLCGPKYCYRYGVLNVQPSTRYASQTHATEIEPVFFITTWVADTQQLPHGICQSLILLLTHIYTCCIWSRTLQALLLELSPLICFEEDCFGGAGEQRHILYFLLLKIIHIFLWSL